MKIISILALFALMVLLSIAVAEEEHRKDHHEHKAPHGGTLVVFGDELAHLELVLDPKEGKLTAYVLDGEAENSIRIDQGKIVLKVSIEDSDRQKGENLDYLLKLNAIADVLTGETEGDTSEFSAQSDYLKDVTDLDAVVTEITIKGKKFKDVVFNFPKGNED